MEPILPEQTDLPYSRLALILGVFSILTFFFIGILLGVGSLLAAGKAHRLFAKEPERYTLNSYNRVAIGKICAVTGLIIGSFFVFY